MKDGSCFLPLPALGVQANQGIKSDRVELEIRLSEFFMNQCTNIKTASSNTFFEEKGVSLKIRVRSLVDHVFES